MCITKYSQLQCNANATIHRASCDLFLYQVLARTTQMVDIVESLSELLADLAPQLLLQLWEILPS